MTSRLLAATILLVSALAAWLTLTSWLAARALQVLILFSLLYVGYLAWRGWRLMRRPEPVGDDESTWHPSVTLIVPARNEATVIGTLVEDLVNQDYALIGRLDILIVDDGSTDGTAQLAAEAAAGSPRVRVLRREQAPSTKASVLAHVQPMIDADLVGVLDADSRVAAGFVSRVVRAWSQMPEVAALQVLRRSANAGAGWLAAAQDDEQLMDMASQCGRSAANGTAELRGNGMFVAREVLERVGGWNAHALTEDLELSTRLAAAGERTDLVPRAVIREESVQNLAVLWRQRMRWAEGSMRRLMQLGPGLITSRSLPVGRRLDFLLFTTEFVVPPLFVTTTIASLLTIPLPGRADWTVPGSLFVGYGLGSFLLALAGLAAAGVRGARLFGRALRGSLFLSHWLLVVPAALARIVLGPSQRTFTQTPHLGPNGSP